MAQIAFALLPGEPGHRQSAIALALRLRERSHHVRFLGIADEARIFQARGLEYVVVAPRTVPPGSLAHEPRGGLRLERCEQIAHELLGDLPRLRRMKLDLVVADVSNPIARMMGRRVAPRVIDLHTAMPVAPDMAAITQRTPDQAPPSAPPQPPLTREDRLVAQILGPDARFTDLAHPPAGRSWAGLVTCPRALELPEDIAPFVRYVDPLVDLDRPEPAFDWTVVPRGRRLIYVSMGTQAWRRDDLAAIYRALFAAIGGRRDWFAIIASGVTPTGGDLPPNIVCMPFAPQLTLLQRADVMVTHGGLNSVKEAILAGVPMLVVPLIRDQPRNAIRVLVRGLGLALNADLATPRRLRARIAALLEDPAYRTQVRRMRAVFRRATAANLAVTLIEEALRRG